MLSARNGTLIVCAVAALALLFGLWIVRPERRADRPPAPIADPKRVDFSWMDKVAGRRIGFFNPVRESGPTSEEAAKLEALGYLDGYEPPSDKRGVLVHDTERAQPGYNLYVSAHAPAAHLIDMSGEVVHRWELSYAEACPDLANGRLGQDHWRRAKLLGGGDLLVVFDNHALVRLDKASNPIWIRCDRYHHDVSWDAEGRIFALRSAPRLFRHAELEVLAHDDLVDQISGDGELLASTSLLDALERSRFSDLLDGVEGGGILHTNTISLLEGRAVEQSRQFAAGQLLLSFRNLHTLAVLDLESEEIVWAAQGPWRAQHAPVLLESGRILVFDNLGLGDSSRVVEFDPNTNSLGWSYPKTPSPSFFSPVCGSMQRLSNGNTLIVESTAGRALEVTFEGEIVWEFRSPHRVDRGGKELVALVDNLHRITPAAVESWLGQ